MEPADPLVVQMQHSEALPGLQDLAVGEANGTMGTADVEAQHRSDRSPWRIELVPRAVEAVPGTDR